MFLTRVGVLPPRDIEGKARKGAAAEGFGVLVEKLFAGGTDVWVGVGRAQKVVRRTRMGVGVGQHPPTHLESIFLRFTV